MLLSRYPDGVLGTEFPGRVGVDPKFETLRNRTTAANGVRMAAARVFKVEFRIR